MQYIPHSLKKLTIVLVSLVLVLSTVGCQAFGLAGSTSGMSPLPTLALSGSPDTEAWEGADLFLKAWQAEDYPKMYQQLSGLTRDALPQEEFIRRYQQASIKMTLTSLEYEILGSLTSGETAEVSFRVVYHTGILGDLVSQMVMPMVLEEGQWRIRWEDGLIHEWLKGGNSFVLEIVPPSRGNINDRQGRALAAFTDAVALGVVPERILPAQEATLLAELAQLTGKSEEQILALYQDKDPTWYVPVGEASEEAVKERLDVLKTLEPGLQMTTFRARYYYDGSAAPHVIGYIQPIPAETLTEYQSQGYLGDEKVGAAGLEAWGEPYLRGKPKAALYVVNPQGETVTRLAEVQAQPAENIITTLDKDLQLKIQRSMTGLRGAVVVMERDTGRILAMASSPTFDANIFEPNNLHSSMLSEVYNDPGTPLLNRASQGVYPLGSIFKTITMAAALESGRYTPESEYMCGHVYNELDVPFYDWTYQHGVAASGLLTLTGGLIRSCNPWFWHIGLDLYQQTDHQDDVVEMAKAFGLGSLTGIHEVAEVAGSVPEPENEYQAIGLAIGQDELQVTPLQVVDFIAALGNGGTLYRPQLVERIVSLDGNASYSFKPEVRGKLPVGEANLKAIQDGMYGVVNSAEPMGTAYFVLANLPVPVAGKTGTAQTADEPHAWFAGYTQGNLPEKPDIAVVVLLENAGEGSLMAAPLFRRVVQLYFSDNTDPGPLLPWEDSVYGMGGQESSPNNSVFPLMTETPAP